MSWRRPRTLMSRWNFWRAITRARMKWMLTNGDSAMRWPETQACLLARTMWKRPGALSILSSKQALRSTTTNQIAGVRVRSKRKFCQLVAGITRGWRDERTEHGVMEYRSIGVLGKTDHSITPPLQYSNLLRSCQ